MSPKNASIQLKLAKANSLLAEVDVLVHHKFYMTAINRLYYGCFHVTKALIHYINGLFWEWGLGGGHIYTVLVNGRFDLRI